MKTEEFLKEFKQITVKMYEVAEAKNADYASGVSELDPLANLHMCETLNVAKSETGFLVRMCDKFSRIITFVNKGVLKVKDESIEDTLIDFANYCILLAIDIRDKKRKGVAQDGNTN